VDEEDQMEENEQGEEDEEQEEQTSWKIRDTGSTAAQHTDSTGEWAELDTLIRHKRV